MSLFRPTDISARLLSSAESERLIRLPAFSDMVGRFFGIPPRILYRVRLKPSVCLIGPTKPATLLAPVTRVGPNYLLLSAPFAR